MIVERGRLDDVFRQITTSETGAPRCMSWPATPDHRPARARELLRHAARLCLHHHLPGADRRASPSTSAASSSAVRPTSRPSSCSTPGSTCSWCRRSPCGCGRRSARSGTIELLMTLPITTWEAVLGKFLAAWAFVGVALVLTFPMWITVNLLGDPDNGVILASYIGSFLMAGAFLAIGACDLGADQEPGDRLHRRAPPLCFLFLMSGVELVLNVLRAWAPPFLVSAVASMSFLVPLRPGHQGRARSVGPGLLPVADRLCAVCQPHIRRAQESRLRRSNRG